MIVLSGKSKIKIILFLFLLIFFVVPVSSQNVNIIITGFRSSQGQVIVSVFKDNKSFQEEKPFSTKTLKKSEIKNGMLMCTLTLQPGEYGLALLDDENSNNLMEYNLLGMPKEGFGFSNFVLKGFYRPTLDDFKFTVTDGKTSRVVMQVKYF